MPSPAQAGGVLPALLAQTGGREGSQHPSKECRDRDGDGDREGQGVQRGCTVLHPTTEDQEVVLSRPGASASAW